jgi:hypothetical protein
MMATEGGRGRAWTATHPGTSADLVLLENLSLVTLAQTEGTVSLDLCGGDVTSHAGDCVGVTGSVCVSAAAPHGPDATRAHAGLICSCSCVLKHNSPTTHTHAETHTRPHTLTRSQTPHFLVLSESGVRDSRKQMEQRARTRIVTSIEAPATPCTPPTPTHTPTSFFTLSSVESARRKQVREKPPFFIFFLTLSTWDPQPLQDGESSTVDGCWRTRYRTTGVSNPSPASPMNPTPEKGRLSLTLLGRLPAVCVWVVLERATFLCNTQ